MRTNFIYLIHLMYYINENSYNLESKSDKIFKRLEQKKVPADHHADRDQPFFDYENYDFNYYAIYR